MHLSQRLKGMMKYDSENTLDTVDSSVSFDYNESTISAITLEDDFAPCRPVRRLDRFDSKRLQSLAEQKRASDPDADELQECLDALRAPELCRFSSCSSDSTPMAMPKRTSSSHGLDYRMALYNEKNACSSLFLDDDESPFQTIECDGETREYIEPLGSFDSFTITLNDEDEFKAPVKQDKKRKPRRSYRGRRSTKATDAPLGGYSRTAISAQSLELEDIFGDDFDQ